MDRKNLFENWLVNSGVAKHQRIRLDYVAYEECYEYDLLSVYCDDILCEKIKVSQKEFDISELSIQVNRAIDRSYIILDDLYQRFNHPDFRMVDLGLSVKWCDFNLGARRMEDCGKKYGYGISDFDTSDEYSNKFNLKYGTFRLLMLGKCDDVASHILGEEWRLPTQNEVIELWETCCVSRVSVINGKTALGTVFVSKKTNRALFLPDDEIPVHYWTSSLKCKGLCYSDDNDTFHGFGTDENYCESSFSAFIYISKSKSYNVRPVYGGNHQCVDWIAEHYEECTRISSKIRLVYVSQDKNNDTNGKRTDFIGVTCDNILCSEIPYQEDQKLLKERIGEESRIALSTVEELYDILGNKKVNQRIDMGLSVDWNSHNFACYPSSEYDDFYVVEEDGSFSLIEFDSPLMKTLIQNPFYRQTIFGKGFPTSLTKTSFRLPTKDEASELIENTYFTFGWDVPEHKIEDGAILVSKINHKALFIPATDSRSVAYGRGDYLTCCDVKLKDGFYMSFDHRGMFPIKNFYTLPQVSYRPVYGNDIHGED